MAANAQPIAVIARLLDLSERRIQQLSREGVIPKAERGQYDLVAAVRGYVAYLRDLAVKAQAGAPDFGAERARLIKAKADLAEMEADGRRGELLPADAVEVAVRLIAALPADMRTSMQLDYERRRRVELEEVTGAVVSPTFVIARVHTGGRVPMVHVDAYRLGGVAEVDDLDLDVDVDDSVTVVEWGSGVAEQLAPSWLLVDVTRRDDDVRVVQVRPHGPRWGAPS